MATEKTMQKSGDAKSFLPGRAGSAEFAKALARGGEALSRRFRGWAKPSEAEGCFAFAPLSRCGVWVDIPIESVHEVEVLGQATCREHTHPIVQLEFVSGNEAYVVALCQALAALQSQERELQATKRRRSNVRPNGLMATHMPDTGCPGHWNGSGDWECDDSSGEDGGLTEADLQRMCVTGCVNAFIAATTAAGTDTNKFQAAVAQYFICMTQTCR